MLDVLIAALTQARESTAALVETRVAQTPGADGLPQSLAPLQALVSTSADLLLLGGTNGDFPPGEAALDSSETA